ncbi:MAG: hypothetical protein FWC26_06515 [Fibromonadales bacterium]|nr:hypothetical protein [Fibromonadales bacterium]
MFTIILTELSMQSDLKAVVGAIASVLNISKKEAIEKAKNLPLTLAVDLPKKEAKLMADMFGSMGAEIKVTPPLDETPARPLREPKTELPKRGIPIGCLIFLMLCLIAFAVFATMKYEWIMKQFEPSPAKSEKLLLKGDMNKAKRSIQKQLRQNPTDSELLVLQGRYYMGAARKRMDAEKWKSYGEAGALPELDSAVAFFREAESRNPKDGSIPRWISMAEQMRRYMAAAETAARRAIAIDPQDTDNWNQLGSVLLALEQTSQAENAFYNALKLKENDFATLKNMTILNLYYTKDAQRAAKFLFVFLEQEEAFADMDAFKFRTDLASMMIGDYNPPFEKMLPPALPFDEYERRRAEIISNPKSNDDPLLQEELGLLHMSIGESKAAENCFLRAIQFNSKMESSRKMLAVIYMRELNYEAALKMMQAAVGNSRDPFFWKNIGVLQKYYKADSAEASKAFKRYLDLGGDPYESRVRKGM